MKRTKHIQFLKNTLKVSLATIVVGLVACMPKIENEDPVDSVVITGNDIVNVAGAARIHIYGTCPAQTKILKVMVDQSSFNVSSSSSIVDSSGIPAGTCTNGSMTVTYPVSNPAQSRTIVFKIKAQMNDGRVSLYWAQISVNYAMPTTGVAGFAVTAGGASATGGADKVWNSMGEPYSYLSSFINNTATIKAQTGVNGIIFDDGI